ncbi:hypothetical protein ONA92_25770 [Mycobacteroides salmoniphilum]
MSTQAYVLTSNDGTLSPASIGSLATLPGVQGSAATPLAAAAPAPSLFTAIQPVFTVLGGALTLPFNIPFWFVTGQLNAAANQTTINNFVAALGQLPGVPAAVLSYLAGIPSQTLPTIPGLTTAAASPAVKTAALSTPAAAAAPAPSLFTAIQPVFTVLGGALTLPFNIPFWFVTGQLNAAANQKVITDFVTALGQLPGVPAAVLSYLAGIPSQTLPTIPSIPGLTTAAASPAVKTAALSTPAAAAAPAPSLFTAIQPVFTVLGGALTLPFNVPFWYATGQLNTAANQKVITDFVTALGQLPGVPAAVLSYLQGITKQTPPTIPTIPGITSLVTPSSKLITSAATVQSDATKPEFAKSEVAKSATLEDATKPATSAEPVKVTTPAEPAKPVEAATPVEAVKPATPAEPVKVTTPAEPAKPATSVEPVKVTAPAEPAKPVEAATPVEAVKPAAPAEPAKPATPADAVKPAEPKVNVPKVKLPTPVTKVGEVSGGVSPKTEDSAKADKSEKADSKDAKSDKGSAPKKSENDSSAAKKPESAASSTGKSESASSSSSSDSHSSASNGSSHSDSHKASSD